jgi:hypothetical protein
VKKPGNMLAVVFGGKPGKGASMGPGMGKGMAEDDSEEEGEDEMPSPDFEENIVKAFPDLEQDPERIQALHKAIRSC